jgi:ribosomal protein L11 methylase PrmA
MITAEPGSFRDPASRVVDDDGRVVRLLDERGLAAWEALSATPFYRSAVEAGDLIDSTPLPSGLDGAAGALEHPRLPMITYPYEWTFSMLKDAAVLQLDLLERAIGAGLTIKDSTPFNVQFDRGRPVFIDIGSFEKYREGEPWLGYRQFTRQYLFPLMMRAWAGLPFQPWLRGDMEGPTAAQMRAILAGRKRFNTGRLMHVTLQARMEASMSGAAVRADLKTAGFNADLILANVRKLRKLVESLSWGPDSAGWSGYHECTHVGRDREAKSEFLRGILGRVGPSRVLDLGANDGHFSMLAANAGAHTVAVDGDEAVLDDLYLRSRGANISIALTDLTNPPPSQGWAGTERPSLLSRSRPDLVVAYGLIHHLIYTASVPPRAVLEWLRGLDAVVALEFVAPTDEMVTVLTANKLDQELHTGRTEPDFRRIATDLFQIRGEQSLGSGSRVLFELAPR